MSFHGDRRRMLGLGAGVLAGFAVRPARSCEVVAEFLRVTHPWSRATAPDERHAILCMRIDEVSAPDRLIGASTPIATGCEMGGGEPGRALDIELAPGQVLEMHEAGVHVVLTGLRHPLQPGRDYALALEFERSGTVLARLNVDFPALRFR